MADDNSGNNYNAWESRDGHDTQGGYNVHLPDGRVKEVTYYVNGDSGYVADVTYEGEAQYAPAQTYAPAPSYQPPPTYH